MKTENRLLRLPEVLERVPFGKTTLYRLQSEGSFPQGIQLGSNMVAWVASDIDKWV